MADKAGGSGTANDATAEVVESDERPTDEQRLAATRDKRIAQADAVVDAAKAKVKNLEAHLVAANKALKDARAEREGI